MADPINAILNLISAFFNDFFSWYGGQLLNFPFSFVSYIISLFFLGIFLQLIVDAFKFMRGIINVLFFPLRIIHVWFHIREAKKIAEKKEKTGEWRDAIFLTPRLYMSFAIGQSDDFSRIGIGGALTIREAWKIASAPSNGTLFMIAVLTFLTPFLRVGVIGLLIHLYLYCGTALVLLPSSADYHGIIHALLVHTEIHPFFYLWSVAVFSIGFAIAMSMLPDPLVAVAAGLIMALIYLFILITIIVFSDPKLDEMNVITGDIEGEMKNISRIAAEAQQFQIME